MKAIIFSVMLLVGTAGQLKAQYQKMNEDFIEVGAGNFFVHLDKEADVKKLVNSVIKINRFPNEELVFNKGKNVYFSAYYVNPSDDNYVYIIHAVRAIEGYELYFLYCVNTLSYHFEYEEGNNLYQLVYDPEKNKSKLLTSFSANLVDQPWGKQSKKNIELEM